MIGTIDLKNIHDIFLEIKKYYPKYGERFLYFLAACQYLDPDIDLEVTLKLRPYGGLIGIDNSSHRFPQQSIVIQTLDTPVLPCPITNEFLGHITGFVFFVCEDVQKQFVHFVGMLKQKILIVDFEGFRYKKTGFIIKELSLYYIRTIIIRTILFLPPVSHNSFSVSDRRSHKWATRFLHGLSCNSGTYPYWFITNFLSPLKLHFPLGKFYAKGKEKIDSLQTLLQKEVLDLETLCPRVEEIKLPIDNITCALHSFYLTEKRKRKHCAKRKAQLYFYWISLSSNEPSIGEGSSVGSLVS